MAREHRGCGTHNPFSPRIVWALAVLASVITIGVAFTAHTLWGLIAVIPWLASIIAAIRWEIIHRPSKMYVTWWP